MSPLAGSLWGACPPVTVSFTPVRLRAVALGVVTSTWDHLSRDREPGPRDRPPPPPPKQGCTRRWPRPGRVCCLAQGLPPLGTKSSGSQGPCCSAALHGFGSNSKLLTGGRARRRGAGSRATRPLPAAASPGPVTPEPDGPALPGADAHLTPSPSLGFSLPLHLSPHVYPDLWLDHRPLIGTRPLPGGTAGRDHCSPAGGD